MRKHQLILLSIFAFGMILSHPIAMAIYYKGLPYSWQLGGNYVVDKSYYGGRYYQVNDTIRVLPEKGSDIYYDKFMVYVKKDSNWIKTEVYTYKSTHTDFNDCLDFLRSKYNDFIRNKSDDIWVF